MLIKEAIIYPLSAKLHDDSFASGRGLVTERTSVIVLLKDDNGQIGIGESGVGNLLSITYKIRESLEVIVNREQPYNRISESLFTQLGFQEEGNVGYSAISAIDIALNDLLSRDTGSSLSDVYGGATRSSIPVYAGTGYFHMDRSNDITFLSEQVRNALDMKVKGIKIKIGGDVSKDLERIRCAQDIIQGQVPLMVDANESYDRLGVTKLVRLIRDDVMFLEEPVEYGDYATLKRISEMGISVAAGENISTINRFLDYMDKADVTVIEPDITKVGGVKGLQAISAVCNAKSRLMYPHNWSTPISTLATASFMLTLPAKSHSHPYGPNYPLLELDLSPNPLREVLTGDYTFDSGNISMGKSKGLGVELDESKLRKYMVHEPVKV